MKRVVVGVVLAAFLLILGSAHIVEAATLDDAKALGIKAAAFVKANGKDKGIAELSNPKGQFSKGELYVTLHDLNGTILAFSPNPKLMGQNHLEVRDSTGRYLTKEMVEIAKNQGRRLGRVYLDQPCHKKGGKEKGLGPESRRHGHVHPVRCIPGVGPILP